MSYYEIKANGRFYDEVYYDKPKTNEEIKKYFQALLKTDNIKVRRILNK